MHLRIRDVDDACDVALDRRAREQKVDLVVIVAWWFMSAACIPHCRPSMGDDSP